MSKSKGIKGVIIAAIAVLAVIIAVVAAKAFTDGGSKYEDVFYPGTTLNGIDISGLSAQEAGEKLSSMSADYKLDVVLQDGTVTLSAAENWRKSTEVFSLSRI